MPWKGKKVLVTGAGGFIGSHLCDALVREGAEVTALLRYTSRADRGNLNFLPKETLDSMRFAFGTVEDATFVEDQVRGKDVILHLAALIGIPYSYAAPRSYMGTNVAGTINLLEAVRKHPVQAFVHTSTSEVYGTAQYTPIDEAHPLQGQSPYSASKIAADKFVESYIRSFGLNAVVLRPFNTYGPRQSTRAVIPTVISQALFASEIRLGSLSPIRDFLYVTDTVDAFLKAASTPKAIGRTIHVGTGKGISIGDLVEQVNKLTGTEKPVVTEEERKRPKDSEVFELLCNPTQATEILSWTPTVTLEQGLSHSMEFIAEHADKSRLSQYMT